MPANDQAKLAPVKINAACSRFSRREHMKRRHPDWPTLVAGTLLAGMTLATLAPVISCEFINVDDVAYVTANHHVRQGLSFDNVGWALTAMEAANWHPVTWLSHMLDTSLFGLNPKGHHGTSLLIHTLNVVLLFFWLRTVTDAVWKSALVAAFFAVHPLALESVAFIAERKNVLSTFFLLLTLFAYLWYVRKPGWPRYLLVAFAFALGLMSKPMLVTVPFALLLLDYWPLDRLVSAPASPGMRAQRPLTPHFATFVSRCREKIPLLVLSAVSSVLTLRAQALDNEIKSVPLLSRVANAALSYGIYLKQMIWPSQLAIFYPYRSLALSSWQVVISFLVVCLITTLVVWQIKKRPYLAVGWFWYLGTLIPAIGLVHVGDLAHADRYTYVPLLGIFIAIAWGAGELGKSNLRYGLIAAATIAVAALAITTTKDISYWHDGISISEHSIDITGPNCLMERTLGETLYSQGRIDEALVHLLRSVRIEPTDVALYDLGTIKLQQNKLDEAAYYLEQALRYPGEARTLAQIHNNLAALEMQQGLAAEAEKNFEQSVMLDPDSARHRVAYGWLLAKEAKYDAAVSQFEAALKTSPDAMTYFYLGSALEQQHKLGQAADAYRKTLALSPNLTEAHARLEAIGAVRQ